MNKKSNKINSRIIRKNYLCATKVQIKNFEMKGSSLIVSIAALVAVAVLYILYFTKSSHPAIESR